VRYSRPPMEPDLAMLTLRSSRAPLLIPQGRRDLVKGAQRAVEWLADMDPQARSAEWQWLTGGEQEPIRITPRKAPNAADGWDTYSLGRLYPGAMLGNAICAWLPVLACFGASLLGEGRQNWRKLQSRHPDVRNNLWCVRPAEWASAAEIARWYVWSAGAKPYELRPMTGELMSYCEVQP